MDVVIAVIKNVQGQILITKRPFDVREGGKWEFPGGKINPNESPLDALGRELYEELGIYINHAQYFMEISDDCVRLLVYQVLSFRGIPACFAGQLDLRWVSSDSLHAFSFPMLNQPIIDALFLLGVS